MSYLTDMQAKSLICEYGKRLYDKGLVVSNAGNITCKVSETELWATPTGVCKGDMSPEMLIKMDLEGNVLEQVGNYRPSSEIKMHLGVLKANPALGGCVHAHPVYASVFSVIEKEPTVHTLIEALAFGESIPMAPFAIPGTYEVPDSVVPFCKDHTVAILSHHGALAWGPTIDAAYFNMEALENYCQIYVISMLLGGPKPIDPQKYDEMLVRFGLKK